MHCGFRTAKPGAEVRDASEKESDGAADSYAWTSLDFWWEGLTPGCIVPGGERETEKESLEREITD